MLPIVAIRAVLVNLVVWTVPAHAAGQSFDPEQLRRLKAGEVLVDVRADPQGATGLITATIDIQAPPRMLWGIMLDCERSKRITPALKVCRVTETSSDGLSDVREHVVQWVWPLPAVRSVFASQYRPYEQIRFQRIDGDLEFLEGTWQLEPTRQGAATRLTYTARITPGWPVPGALVRGAMESDIPKTLTALRREATGRE
jgi:ribosome-associated toxin RatA of RatAB toxin-antitoxin module